jgi:hypothetical protein
MQTMTWESRMVEWRMAGRIRLRKQIMQQKMLERKVLSKEIEERGVITTSRPVEWRRQWYTQT